MLSIALMNKRPSPLERLESKRRSPRWLRWTFALLLLAGLGLLVLVGAWRSLLPDIEKHERAIESISSLYSTLSGGAQYVSEFLEEKASVQVYSFSSETQKSFIAATAHEQREVVYLYKTIWMGSEKSIKLRAIYKIIAGVDLDKIRYAFDNNKVVITDAQGELLACERISLVELSEDTGLINWISDHDRQLAQNALDQEAYKLALKSGILEKARQHFLAKIRAMPQLQGQDYHFELQAQQHSSPQDSF